jgi:hypothetical protein
MFRRRWLLLLSATAALASAGTQSRNDGLAASTVSAGKRVQVSVEVETLTYESPLRGQVWGCDDCGGGTRVSDARTTHVTKLDLREGKKQIIVPLSAYADLGNPTAITFRKEAKGLVFVIEGGDTTIGHGYEASFFLETGAIMRRRVVLKGDPNESWEETRYARPTTLD